MFKTRKVIAEIFSIVGAIREQCTSNPPSRGLRVKVEPDPSTGLEFSIAIRRWGEVYMPHYEFVCNACKKTFSKILTISEHDAERTACPHCGSHEVEQRWSAFSAITSKKSA
jgi:putative FmdB family regulatory protein